MVVPVCFPSNGVLLRWSFEEKQQTAAWLGIHLRPAAAAWAEAADDLRCLQRCSREEIYIYLNSAKITNVQEYGLNQRELFLPAKHPGTHFIDTAQHYELQIHRKYHARLIFFSTQGRLIEQSRWSPEFMLESPPSFLTFSLLLLKKSIQTNVSSLDIFLRKFAAPARRFSIPVELHDLQMHIFAVPCAEQHNNPTYRYAQTLNPKPSYQALVRPIRLHKP